jgi:hypothetical protein
MEPKYQYPHLFHKHILGINSVGPPTYEVIWALPPTSEHYVSHFHIFDLDKFETFRAEIELIRARMPIVITHSLGSVESIRIDPTNLGLLKIPNRGYDLGAKICCVDYLDRAGIKFEYILMLHSKSNPARRREYFDPFIKSGQRLDLICELLRMKRTNLLGIFPNVIWHDHQGQKNYPRDDVYQYDWLYYWEIMAYLGCKNSDKIFAEGNVMILHRSVIDFVWGSNLDLFYQAFNSGNSFDWNWFKIQYPRHQAKSIQEAYWFYKAYSLWGNNTPIIGQPNSNAGAMIEHIFERIWINVILHLGGQYLVLSGANLMETYKIKIRHNIFSKSPGLRTQIRLVIKAISLEHFDGAYYLDCNPDVKNEVGRDFQRAYEHFLHFGIAEKRPARFTDPYTFMHQIPYDDSIRSQVWGGPNQDLVIAQDRKSEVDFRLGLTRYDPSSFRKILYKLLGTILLHHTCDWGVIVPLNHLITITGQDSTEECLYLEILADVSYSI